ncbi:Re/Si-specific NAD(P)(+) transhydrogenase subunit alpha [Enterobacteriaceae endosymbiont of Donacia thalassina]|uniref:Re/Si-specific NAD(P)(+) transhydrogenase subunit alpha n=1 Tax=Enterobacteriaceae endosymbiont of Donacia thalassina TaxID=2675786 RepID=UPI00144A0DD1|nr:Re/Si-specific NAD(P)(+) transhydrogenase subunit alpha [Enterobacteriaceae endosymbiont of Donacia thalassina]QJC37202.1 Re/Si-specific NAD(P)(+) transhydrogenase subunit alpha [Enterobacteriaceae endosymbiont of Donacia thalassina]
MIIGIPKEKYFKEKRIAMTPSNIKKLIKLGFEVYVEEKAGLLSYFQDQDFINAGAKIVENKKVWESNIIIKIHPLDTEETNLIKNNSILISFIWPYKNNLLLKILAEKNITTIAMDTVPRISRAQSLDALSSMNNLSGYRSIIESINLLQKTPNGQITAAGKILPAKIMVIGAGVAGLSAIGTAKSLGAKVIAFDKRKEVKEQIHSMGAEFLELKDQQKDNDYEYKTLSSKKKVELEKKFFNNIVKTTDIIITTAVILNKKAPILITKEMIKLMKPGSIIFDLAIENGGNCELTKINKIITTENNIKILGLTNLPSKLAPQASQLYSTNIINLINLLSNKNNSGKIFINLKDEIIRNMTIIHDSQIIWPAPQSNLIKKKKDIEQNINFNKTKDMSNIKKKTCFFTSNYFLYTIGLFCIYYITEFIPREIIPHFIIFLLSCIIGYYVVWNVDHKLHTPLMSVTNAISGIIIIGSILQVNSNYFIIILLSFLGTLLSSINIFGGLTITQRMLQMFRKN